MKNNLEVRTAIFRNGKQITEDLIGFNFKQIGDYTILFNSNSLLIVDKDGNATLSEESSDNELLKPLQFDDVHLLEPIEPHVDPDSNVYLCRNHYAIEVSKNGLKGVYSHTGKLIVPIVYDHNDFDKCDLIVSTSGSSRCVCSYDGDIIVPLSKYDYLALDFVAAPVILVQKNLLMGVYSHFGDIIVPMKKFDSIDINSEEIVAYKNQSETHYSFDGQIISPTE